MNKYKLRLIGILVIQLIITAIHKTSPDNFDASNFYHVDNWTYWLGMGWGIFAIVYAIKLACPYCGAKQVLRGLSVFSLRWPQDQCHKCGAKIE
jgi:predicted RNA-binding Zn-ribbon protein involved in translation (DUF1610 family)